MTAQEQISWDNWVNWQHVTDVGYIAIYSCPITNLWWAWYHNELEGDCKGGFATLEEAQKEAEYMNCICY